MKLSCLRASKRSRRSFLICLGLGVILTVTGCGASAPSLHPDPVPSQPPTVVQQSQINEILGALASELKASQSQSSASALLTRVGNPALALRSDEFALAAAGGQNVIEGLGTTFTGTIVSSSTTWPRSFIVGADPLKAGDAGFLYLMTQHDARSRYTLNSWAQVLPNTQMPPTVSVEKGGNAAVSMTDSTRSASPDDALAWYAELLSTGSSAPHAADFPANVDVARAAWNNTVNGLKSVVNQIHGTLKQSSVVDANTGGQFAVQTADGGAIVMGVIVSSITFTLPANTTQYLNLPAEYSVFTKGNIKVTKSATLQYTNMVALWIPPKGSTSKITVLAVSQVPSNAKVS